MAQQWVHEAQSHREGNRPSILPEEYQRHAIIFDEEASMCFPLSEVSKNPNYHYFRAV